MSLLQKQGNREDARSDENNAFMSEDSTKVRRAEIRIISDLAYSKALREETEKDENGVFTSEDSIRIRRRRKDAENKKI